MDSSAARLKVFRPLAHLDEAMLAELAGQVEWRRAKKDDLILGLGAPEEDLIFLLDGRVSLKAADGRERLVSHADSAALGPLSLLRPSKYEIRALGPVEYVRIKPELLDHLPESIDQFSAFNTASQYVVSDGKPGDEDPVGTLLVDVYSDLHEDRLRLWSWRPASRAICAALLLEKYDMQRTADLVQMETGLAIKILRASARKSGTSIPASSCLEAVLRLGLPEVQRIAFLNLFSESIAPQDDLWSSLWLRHWESSVLTAQLSLALAKQCHSQETTEAALAGLFSHVGEQIILSYAWKSRATIGAYQLTEALRLYGRDTGKVALAHWRIPEHLIRALGMPVAGQDSTLTDMVLVASSFGHAQVRDQDIDLAARRLGASGANIKALETLREESLASAHAFIDQGMQ